MKHMCTSSGAYELNNEYASTSDLITLPERVPIFYSAIKHGYRCFVSMLFVEKTCVCCIAIHRDLL